MEKTTTQNRFISDLQPAVLALANGAIFTGIAIGASGQAIGEVVFNTSMTGYQEILTDPSYAEQIVTLTYPHIGNVGINRHDAESNRVWVKGLIIRELSLTVSNWRSQQSLVEYLIKHNIVAIADIDTRRLTRLLRTEGSQAGCILTGNENSKIALQAARSFSGIKGKNLTQEVTNLASENWEESVHYFESSKSFLSSSSALPFSAENTPCHVVVYNFGVKQQILRLLKSLGCQVTVVPATTSTPEILALKPHGILLSNGPGDPEACDDAIKNIQSLFDTNIPIFGICLGFQLLALAYGAKTQKMKFGHHGANHPVQDIEDKSVSITSQNHSFCVLEENLPTELTVTHRSLFDGSLQGFRHRSQPVFAFQGHPEASPGPNDINGLFKQFYEWMKKHANA